MGFPGGTEEYRIPGGKECACNAENPGSILGSGRSPGEGNGYPWIHTPEFLPGEFHGQQSLMGYSPWGCKEVNTTKWLTLYTYGYTYIFISVQFSRSVVSDSSQPHESQHSRPPCPSPTLGVHSNSRPSNRWCHPAILSSVVPFSSCSQSLPTSESFPMSQLFTWGGQSTGVSALASFLQKKSQGWSLEWTGWISLQSEGPSRVFSNTTVQKHQFFGAQLSSQSNFQIHTWPLEKP